MVLSRATRIALRIFVALVIALLYAPLLYVARLSISTAHNFAWPPRGWTVGNWRDAMHEPGPRAALWHSMLTATTATVIALVLGTLAAFALSRHRFFGRNTVGLALVLPIALPGIVTAIALRSAFDRINVAVSSGTLAVAHATFCVVIVYNNVSARLGRVSRNLDEASADLGAGPLQTLRYVTFPLMRTALLAGALLAFALSFDEIIVTTFNVDGGYQTLPLWFADNFARPNKIPVVNVVATFVVLASIVPVYFAQRISDGGLRTAASM